MGSPTGQLELVSNDRYHLAECLSSVIWLYIFLRVGNDLQLLVWTNLLFCCFEFRFTSIVSKVYMIVRISRMCWCVVLYSCGFVKFMLSCNLIYVWGELTFSDRRIHIKFNQMKSSFWKDEVFLIINLLFHLFLVSSSRKAEVTVYCKYQFVSSRDLRRTQSCRHHHFHLSIKQTFSRLHTHILNIHSKMFLYIYPLYISSLADHLLHLPDFHTVRLYLQKCI